MWTCNYSKNPKLFVFKLQSHFKSRVIRAEHKCQHQRYQKGFFFFLILCLFSSFSVLVRHLAVLSLRRASRTMWFSLHVTTLWCITRSTRWAGDPSSSELTSTTASRRSLWTESTPPMANMMSCLLAQVMCFDKIHVCHRYLTWNTMKETLLTVFSPCRQRDGTKSDQCSQGKLEQHGGASVGRAGGLQSKKQHSTIQCDRILEASLYVVNWSMGLILHGSASAEETGQHCPLAVGAKSKQYKSVQHM